MIKEERQCPRCGHSRLFFTEKAMNSKSRLDNKTEICQACALDEALAGNTYRFRWHVPIKVEKE